MYNNHNSVHRIYIHQRRFNLVTVFTLSLGLPSSAHRTPLRDPRRKKMNRLVSSWSRCQRSCPDCSARGRDWWRMGAHLYIGLSVADTLQNHWNEPLYLQERMNESHRKDTEWLRQCNIMTVMHVLRDCVGESTFTTHVWCDTLTHI